MKIKLGKKEKKVLVCMLDNSNVKYGRVNMDQVVADQLGMDRSEVARIAWKLWEKLGGE